MRLPLWPCSSTCIRQLVAFRTQAQKALWGSFCLTLSLLDNIHMLWFTRLTTKRNRVSFSHFSEAAWLCTYLLEVKWSMKKWLTHQSNLATASKWKIGLLIRLKPKKGLMILLPLHSLCLGSWFYNFFLRILIVLFFLLFGAFQLKESISHLSEKVMIVRLIWIWYSGSHPYGVYLTSNDSYNGECTPHE